MQAWGEDCLSNQLPGNAGLGTDLALQRFRPNSLWLQASPSSPVGQAALSLPVNLPHLPELPGLSLHLVNSALRTRYRQLKQIVMTVITASICVVVVAKHYIQYLIQTSQGPRIWLVSFYKWASEVPKF